MTFSELPWQVRWLARFVVLCVVIVAIANLYSWPRAVPGLLGWFLAALAIVAVGGAFLLWEVLVARFKEGKFGKGFGLLGLFLLACAFDGIGVHNAIHVLSEQQRAAIEQDLSADYSNRLDALQDRRAAIETEISDARARIALVPAADTSGGPQNDAQENLRYETATANDRAEIARLQTEMSRLARDVPRDELPWTMVWGPWAGAGALELIVAFGLTLLGVEVAPIKTMRRSGKKREAPPEAEDIPHPPVSNQHVAPPRAAESSSSGSARSRRQRAPLNLAWSADDQKTG